MVFEPGGRVSWLAFLQGRGTMRPAAPSGSEGALHQRVKILSRPRESFPALQSRPGHHGQAIPKQPPLGPPSCFRLSRKTLLRPQPWGAPETTWSSSVGLQTPPPNLPWLGRSGFPRPTPEAKQWRWGWRWLGFPETATVSPHRHKRKPRGSSCWLASSPGESPARLP